jgi:hypothetical protein
VQAPHVWCETGSRERIEDATGPFVSNVREDQDRLHGARIAANLGVSLGRERGSAVLGDTDEAEDARAVSVPRRAATRVLALETGRAGPQRLQDGTRQVMAATRARRLPTQEVEQGRRVRYGHVPYVGGFRHRCPRSALLDFEAQGLQARHLREKSRGLVFAGTPLGRELSGLPVSRSKGAHAGGWEEGVGVGSPR